MEERGERGLEEVYRTYEVTKRRILNYLFSEELTLTDIFNRLAEVEANKVSKAALSNNLGDLSRDGFLKLGEKRGKGRQKYYTLTDEGREIVRKESIEREIEEIRKGLASCNDPLCMEIFKKLVKAPRGLKADELFAFFEKRGIDRDSIKKKLRTLENEKLVSDEIAASGLVVSIYVRGVSITALIDLESLRKASESLGMGFNSIPPSGDFTATDFGIVLLQESIKNELNIRNSVAFRRDTIEVYEALVHYSLDDTLREELVQEFSKKGNLELKNREFWIKSCDNFGYSFSDCLKDSKKLNEVRESAGKLRTLELFTRINMVLFTMAEKHPEIKKLLLKMALGFSSHQHSWLKRWAMEEGMETRTPPP